MLWLRVAAFYNKGGKVKVYKRKVTLVLLVVELGYISGIIHKLLYSRDIVMALYILNALMVAADITLYIINKRRERIAQS